MSFKQLQDAQAITDHCDRWLGEICTDRERRDVREFMLALDADLSVPSSLSQALQLIVYSS